MADTEDTQTKPKKAGKLPLLIGLVLALGGAAGGFLGVQALTAGDTADQPPAQHKEHADKGDDTKNTGSFLPLDPVLVNIGHGASRQHLRFAATLDVPARYKEEVAHSIPRVRDALNSFLQAVEPRDLAERESLLRLRVLMLHRARLVLGEDKVNDLLISEFVLN